MGKKTFKKYALTSVAFILLTNKCKEMAYVCIMLLVNVGTEVAIGQSSRNTRFVICMTREYCLKCYLFSNKNTTTSKYIKALKYLF